MRTSINGKPAEWTPAIWAKWHTFLDAVDPKHVVGVTVLDANYFVPRPRVDEYNRGSREEGFVYTIRRAGEYLSPVVCQNIIFRLPAPPAEAPPADGTFNPPLSSN